MFPGIAWRRGNLAAGTGDQHSCWQFMALFSSHLTLLFSSWRESQKTLWQEIGNVNKTRHPLEKSKFKGFQTQSPHRSGLSKIVGPVLGWEIQYQLFYHWCCVVRGNIPHKRDENLYQETGWKQCLGDRKECGMIQDSDIVQWGFGKYITGTIWVFTVIFTVRRGKPSDFAVMGKLM